jgi:hypothetical protein
MVFQKDFPLPSSVLARGSAEKILVGTNTDADVLQAIVSDSIFPTRPDGRIELGTCAEDLKPGTWIVTTGL